MRIAHLADLHIGAPLAHKNQRVRHMLRDGLEKTLAMLPETLEKQQVDYLLIAGDFMDTLELTTEAQRQIQQFLDAMEDKKIKTIYVMGNHDWGASNLSWIRSRNDLFQIIESDYPEIIDLQACGDRCRVVACSHGSGDERRNLIEKFPVKRDPMPHIGLVHCMVMDSVQEKQKEKYLPCNWKDLASKGYDYWALGHIHKRQAIRGIQGGYPGNPQGLKLKETGPKGIDIIEIKNNQLTSWFVETASVPIVSLEVDISDIHSAYEVVSLIDQKIKEQKKVCSDVLPLINLIGRSPMSTQFKTSTGLEALYSELDILIGECGVHLDAEQLEPVLPQNFDYSEYPWLMDALKTIEEWSNDPSFEENFLGINPSNYLHSVQGKYIDGLEDHLKKWFREYAHEHC